jgi:hypothetical protein
MIDDDGEAPADCLSAAFAMIGIPAGRAGSLEKCYISFASGRKGRSTQLLQCMRLSPLRSRKRAADRAGVPMPKISALQARKLIN